MYAADVSLRAMGEVITEVERKEMVRARKLLRRVIEYKATSLGISEVEMVYMVKRAVQSTVGKGAKGKEVML